MKQFGLFSKVIRSNQKNVMSFLMGVNLVNEV